MAEHTEIFPIGSDNYPYRKNMVISKRDREHMYFVILSSSSWQSDCVIFSQFKQSSLDLLRSTLKCPALLVLDGCSDVLRVL